MSPAFLVNYVTGRQQITNVQSGYMVVFSIFFLEQKLYVKK
jgi:hypothetical protein